jgi:hypothetical protein
VSHGYDRNDTGTNPQPQTKITSTPRLGERKFAL